MLKKPDPVDVHVGSRLRLRRTLLGLSQEKIGKALGLTFQQIQKYERGANRIGSSRLYRLSKILDVPVQFFFDELNEQALKFGAPILGTGEHEVMARRETLELVRAYYKITNDKVRKRLFELIKAVSQGFTDL